MAYSQAGPVLWSTSGGGPRAARTTAYIYLGGKQIAETNSATGVQYVHTDALGSPVARTNASGSVLNRTRFEAYGYPAAGTKPSPATSQIGFTGHVQDAESELVYMQQRYYDPIAGRFLSVDPVVTDANTGKMFGRYHYGNNNPYKFVDPDGRLPDKVEVRGKEVQITIGFTFVDQNGKKMPADFVSKMNAVIEKAYGGKRGDYQVSVKVIDGDKAKHKNRVIVMPGEGRSQNGGGNTWLYEKDKSGASIYQVMVHEAAHAMDISRDRYTASGLAQAGWEGKGILWRVTSVLLRGKTFRLLLINTIGD